jgi:hypothetical protein
MSLQKVDSESLLTKCIGRKDRAASGSRQRPGATDGKEVVLMEQNEERSWLRLLITIAIDWRLVIAVLLLVLALLRK